MRELYPEIEPFNTGKLEVDGVHRVYMEESGNPAGIPVIFLHGGPGAGCNENHRRYFNPDLYRVVIFDQRGAARSEPSGCVERNTTQDLIADIESIRSTLGIDKWLVFGGSWGATLGLLYAQACPDNVAGMMLRGTFLARQCDLDWFARDGAGRIFPDYWQDFIDPIPAPERHDLVLAYYNRIHGNDEQERIAAAKAWSKWAGRVVTYLLPEADLAGDGDIDQALREVAIETHYARHKYFIAENQILSNVQQLPGVPVKIIHGRKDLTCTMDSSWALHQALPQSDLMIVRDGGHLAGEPAMIDALVNSTDDMFGLLR